MEQPVQVQPRADEPAVAAEVADAADENPFPVDRLDPELFAEEDDLAFSDIESEGGGEVQPIGEKPEVARAAAEDSNSNQENAEDGAEAEGEQPTPEIDYRAILRNTAIEIRRTHKEIDYSETFEIFLKQYNIKRRSHGDEATSSAGSLKTTAQSGSGSSSSQAAGSAGEMVKRTSSSFVKLGTIRNPILKKLPHTDKKAPPSVQSSSSGGVKIEQRDKPRENLKASATRPSAGEPKKKNKKKKKKRVSFAEGVKRGDMSSATRASGGIATINRLVAQKIWEEESRYLSTPEKTAYWEARKAAEAASLIQQGPPPESSQEKEGANLKVAESNGEPPKKRERPPSQSPNAVVTETIQLLPTTDASVASSQGDASQEPHEQSSSISAVETVVAKPKRGRPLGSFKKAEGFKTKSAASSTGIALKKKGRKPKTENPVSSASSAEKALKKRGRPSLIKNTVLDAPSNETAMAAVIAVPENTSPKQEKVERRGRPKNIKVSVALANGDSRAVEKTGGEQTPLKEEKVERRGRPKKIREAVEMLVTPALEKELPSVEKTNAPVKSSDQITPTIGEAVKKRGRAPKTAETSEAIAPSVAPLPDISAMEFGEYAQRFVVTQFRSFGCQTMVKGPYKKDKTKDEKEPKAKKAKVTTIEAPQKAKAVAVNDGVEKKRGRPRKVIVTGDASGIPTSE